jgi:hypothetical protein
MWHCQETESIFSLLLAITLERCNAIISAGFPRAKLTRQSQVSVEGSPSQPAQKPRASALSVISRGYPEQSQPVLIKPADDLQAVFKSATTEKPAHRLALDGNMLPLGSSSISGAQQQKAKCIQQIIMRDAQHLQTVGPRIGHFRCAGSSTSPAGARPQPPVCSTLAQRTQRRAQAWCHRHGWGCRTQGCWIVPRMAGRTCQWQLSGLQPAWEVQHASLS